MAGPKTPPKAAPLAGEPLFIKSAFSIRFGERKIPVNSFISEHGAFHVLEQEKYSDFTGRPVTVEVAGVTIKGRLIREYSGTNSFYNVKFHYEADSQRKAIKEFLHTHHTQPPPWERKYPRFGVSSVAAKGGTVPAHIVAKSGNLFHYPPVINFTLGGILVESQSSGFESSRPTQNYAFDVQLNDGSVIKNLQARVVRVNEDLLPFDGRLFRQVAFEMSIESQNNSVYKSLIRNCLQTLTGK